MTKFLYKNFFIIFIVDVLLIGFSWYFAHLLRFNFAIPDSSLVILQRFIPFVIIIKIIVFYFFNLYEGMWRYTSLADLLSILKAAGIASLVIIFLSFFTHRLGGFSRSIFIIDWVLTLLCVAGSRVVI
ncbi:MAG: polysaccharide biosynthesis protein, partial [Deltaproteobacteria bacterium]|nr:polysaccharide biosynthesis protein [Deltaproteobacteria bacterium]